MIALRSSKSLIHFADKSEVITSPFLSFVAAPSPIFSSVKSICYPLTVTKLHFQQIYGCNIGL
jgi:hypothetical protein